MAGLFDVGDTVVFGFGLCCVLVDISLASVHELFSSFPMEVVACDDGFTS